MPFMNKSLKKAIMKRSSLRNIFVKNKTDTNRIVYIKQRNYCVSLLRKNIKDHYANLNEGNVADNKQFWRAVKPLLSDKVKSSEKITLVEGEEIRDGFRKGYDAQDCLLAMLEHWKSAVDK